MVVNVQSHGSIDAFFSRDRTQSCIHFPRIAMLALRMFIQECHLSMTTIFDLGSDPSGS